MKKAVVPILVLIVILIAGYFIANALIRKKVDEALRSLPASLSVKYDRLHINVLTGSLNLEGVQARYTPRPANGRNGHEIAVKKITVSGLSVIAWIWSHRLRIRDIRLEDIVIRVNEDLMEHDSTLQQLKPPAMDAMVSRVELTRLKVEGLRKGKACFSLEGNLQVDSVTHNTVAAIRLEADSAWYIVPGMEETIRLGRLEIDSRRKLLLADAMQITPDLEKEEIGRLKRHQVDVVRANTGGLEVKGLDVMGLIHRRLHADEISLRGGRVYVFRDRRLPIQPGEKPLPVESLKDIPSDIRVGRVHLESTRVEYEEFPKIGNKTGKLVIERFHGNLVPLLNKPVAGDPAFITLTTEGSLMGSGLVTATMRMPLRKNGYYEVEGAFHDLDVTRLNNPAENLGQLHLESGMLNMLDFQFEMGEERATGKIIGEYHDLVVDKLKEKNGELKTDKLKSFALKKLIIPRNKDKSLPVSKRTGKVDYKRDKQRYFSYYLLHSLLVGVKSSFSLGFLLPG
ncbi:MAG TPA: hypothetical protein VFE32_15065 [Puia sp.]|jgi:hypothetical protein|nr:hypothetical protein [Puia sp.]